MKFVRYGGLGSPKQNGYNPAMPTYHCPPARRGVYAFVFPHIERFLLGSIIFQHHRMEWVKDSKGNKIDDQHPEFASLCDKPDIIHVKVKGENVLLEFFRDVNAKWYLARHKKPRYFDYNGDIWHHLPVKMNERLLTKGSWHKSTNKDYKVALDKEISRINHYKRRTGYDYSSDHLEVFIEKV